MVFIDYLDCNGQQSTRGFATANLYTNVFCGTPGSNPTVYYYIDNVQTIAIESYVINNNECCSEDPCNVYWTFDGGSTGTGGHTTFSYTDCTNTLQYIVVGNGTVEYYCGFLHPTPLVTNDGDGFAYTIDLCP